MASSLSSGFLLLLRLLFSAAAAVVGSFSRFLFSTFLKLLFSYEGK